MALMFSYVSPILKSNMSTNTCGIDTRSIHRAEDNANFVAYSIITWIHLILGAPGHLILLRAFYKQFKREKAYMYQVFATLSELAELFSWVMLVTTIKILSGAESGAGYAWYKKSYTLMWYAAHVVHGAFSFFFTCSVLLSVAMTVDRIYALARPLTYNVPVLDHGRRQIVALLTCFLISLTTCYVEELQFEIRRTSDRYEIIMTEENIQRTFPVILGHLRNIVRTVALFALVISNLILIRYFHMRMLKITPLNIIGRSEEKSRRKKEKILILLTLTQSIFQFTSVTTEISYYAAEFLSPWFRVCLRGLAAPIMDMIVELADLMELYVTFAINKRYHAFLPCTSTKRS